MLKHYLLPLFIVFCGALGGPSFPTRAAPESAADAMTYADLADLALPAKIVAKVRIVEAIPLKPTAAAPSPSARERTYVDAEIVDLIRGQLDTPRAISLLVDVPLDARGRPFKIKKSLMLIFAQPVPSRSGFVQLESSDAAVSWTEQRESSVRAILTGATAADSPPNVRGVDNGFSAAGTVPGERETQIFLLTDSRPVSLNVSRHADMAPLWSVALGEIADHGAPPPTRNSLLWYQLACHLPAQFPEAKLAALPADQVDAVRDDYDLVMKGLGNCPRGRQTQSFIAPNVQNRAQN